MHDIDCHVIVLPGYTDRKWLGNISRQLQSLPVNVHYIEGVIGNIGDGRVRGFNAGSAPFKFYADPDDLIVGNPFPALLEAAHSNPLSPCIYGREAWMDINGQTYFEVPHEDYIATLGKVEQIDMCHHTVLYRMDLVKDYLYVMAENIGIYTEGFFKSALWVDFDFHYINLLGYCYRRYRWSSVTNGVIKQQAPGLTRKEGIEYHSLRQQLKKTLRKRYAVG